MRRKRLTEQFPWLLPLRKKQRRLFFYLGMTFDKNVYAKELKTQKLPYEIYKTSTLMINRDSGFDIKYQYNKVHNLKLAAKCINGLLLRPGETFSFCLATKHADKEEPYKDGLCLTDGKIVGEYGGGLCHMSNFLYEMFLHTPLTVTERHGHESESVPPTDAGYIAGIDATVAEGWLDLKVKNDTAHTFQIVIGFEDERMMGAIFSNDEKCFDYEIYNSSLRYVKRGNVIFEESAVSRKIKALCSGEVRDEMLYENSCTIDYPLPDEIEVTTATELEEVLAM